MTDPVISVMTIVYNGEAFMERCHRNLLAQTFTDWEWIVINDGSTDGTEAILQQLQQREPRLHVTSYPKNVGRAHARTLALKESKGQWVAVWDADDFYFPRRLARIDQARREGFDYYNSSAIVVDQQLNFIGVRGFGKPWPTLDIRTACHAAMGIRLDLAREIGYLPHLKTVGQIGEDVPMIYLPPVTHRGLLDDNDPTFINVIGNEVFLRKSIDANTIRIEYMKELFSRGVLPLTREEFDTLAAADHRKLRKLKMLQLFPPLYKLIMSFRPRGDIVNGRKLTREEERFLDEARGWGLG